MDGRPDVEAQLQHVWDQVLERHPVLLIAIGSDLAMMAALTTYGRPLFGRPTREIVLDPLTVAEVATCSTFRRRTPSTRPSSSAGSHWSPGRGRRAPIARLSWPTPWPTRHHP